MSDIIKHECGLALVRLLKPLDYYLDKYGTALYGLKKMQLLLQKQRNRGQDGAGIGTIKLDPEPGNKYIDIKKSNDPQYIKDLFKKVFSHFEGIDKEHFTNPSWLKEHLPFTGELLLGHLRYGTHGPNTLDTVHPFIRNSNYISKNLMLAGNFNMTNVEELFTELLEYGQYPKEKSDTVTVLEKISHFLDDEVLRLFKWFKSDGYNNMDINEVIGQNLDVQRILRRASRKFDGGYVIAGMVGHGDAFVMRDASGIRPAFYYKDDEIVVVASERPAIQTALSVKFNQITELKRGHALIIKKDGRVDELEVKDPLPRTACSFERIYFSRGTDRDIYLERKELGRRLCEQVLNEVNFDFENTIFSFIPNTAEVSFLGLIKGIEDILNVQKKKKILALKPPILEEDLNSILTSKVRIEKLAVKDAKMRTFIADVMARNELVSHVYDTTFGIVRNEVDTVVLIDDSIVRGTTLKDSILQMVARLHPKKIVIVSSAPQIRYPDCYGIDMSNMFEFVAFKALIALLKETNQENLIQLTYEACKAQEELPVDKIENKVKGLYDLFTYEQISEKISEIVKPEDVDIPISVIYQTLDNLHEACPNNTGDWYFSGNYPTPGGNRVVNRSFINYVEKKSGRSY